MATLLHRLGTLAHRRWPVFIAAWLAALIAVGAFAAAYSKPMTDSFSIPGIPSEEAADLQAELFPGATDAFDQATVTVVVAAPEGERLDDPRWQEATDALVADLAGLPQMPATPEESPTGQLPTNPVDAAAAQEEQVLAAAGPDPAAQDAARANAAALSPLSEDGRVGTITFAFAVESLPDVEPSTREAVLDVLEDARADGLVAEAGGQGMQSAEPPGATAELIGIAVALVVLVLTFGSLVAAGLPILTALIGIALGIAGVTAMTAFVDIGSSTPILATMIGLAVGIDYALFILARYRSELERTGTTKAGRREAVGVAVGTAGSAVVFAGLTVLIALAALAVVRIPFLTAMGLAAAATVSIAVLVALTLLPAVLGMVGSKAFGGTVRRYRPAREADGTVLNNGVRWARLVQRRPWVVAGVVTVALGIVAVPAAGLQLAFPTDSTAASDTTQRKASDLVSEAFFPGREAPLLVVVDARDVPADERGAAYQEVVDWAAGQDGVRNAQVVATNAPPPVEGAAPEPSTGALVQVLPQEGPDSAATTDLLLDLRDEEAALEERTGTDTGITGLTAITTDVSDRLASALPIYLAVVVGLAFLLLMLVFRSVLVPLTATAGFLLSVLATLGLTVAVFQEGALGIMEGQPIVSFMPIFLIGVVFGLAMDYQVFLVTRIREAWVHGASPAEAVVDGFRGSARVVSAAAVIMTAVFAAFMLIDEPVIRSMGFALAVAVVIDAFVIRMTLIPALMHLLGERAWWLPRWLDRALPEVDVEGEKLQAALAARAAEGEGRPGDGDEPVEDLREPVPAGR